MSAEQLVCQSMHTADIALVTTALLAIGAAILVMGLWVWHQHGVMESLADWRENIEQRYWAMQRRFVTVTHVSPAEAAGEFYDKLEAQAKQRVDERIREFDEKLRAGLQNDRSDHPF